MPLKPKSKIKTGKASKVFKKKPAADDKPITNKEIAYAFIVRHMNSIRPNPVVIAAIAGAKFRSNGNRLQKITDMIYENSSKLTKRLKALIEKRGHDGIALVNIDTSTMTDECDTSEAGTPTRAKSEDDADDADDADEGDDADEEDDK